MIGPKQTYHHQHQPGHTYQHLGEALCSQKESLKQPRLRVIGVHRISLGRYRINVKHDQLLQESPQEGWGFYVPGLVQSGRISRVEFQHGYLMVRCEDPLDELGLREITLRPLDFLMTLRQWVLDQSGDLPGLLPLATAQHATPLPDLRARQHQAVEIARPGRSYLWGPPGTGKTYTVGRVVRSLIDRGFKVLVLAPTNVAVDVATLQVDAAFNGQLQPGELLRVGRPELDELEQHPHLLAWQLQQKDWQQRLEQLRRQFRKLRRQLDSETRPSQQRLLDPLLEECLESIAELERERGTHLWRLVGQANILCSTVHSSFQRKELSSFCQTRRLAVIYDEAGMVPRFAQIPLLALISGQPSPCGQLKRLPEEVVMMCSGDPKQLGPIARFAPKDVNAAYWLKDSLMEKMPECRVMLDEQSRMEPPICRVVSRTYYEGRLKTLPDRSRLTPPLADDWPEDGIFLVDSGRSLYQPMHPGERRQDLVRAHTGFNADELSVRVGAFLINWVLRERRISVLWLTPFRAQALRLRQACQVYPDLLDHDLRTGTIHIAQGSQADLVVLDPVKPSHRWFQNDEDIDRLVNVALSRARTQVIVLATANQIRRTGVWWRPLHEAREYRIAGSLAQPRLVQ